MSVDHSGWALDCKVYVGGLGSGADKEELEREFKEYGALKNVWVARNPPGFAFMEYRDPRDAEDAVKALDGILMNGRRIMVQMSNGKTRSKMITSRSRSKSVDSRTSRKRQKRRSRSRSYTGSERSFISRSRSVSSTSRSSRSRGYSRRHSRRKSRSHQGHRRSRSHRKRYTRSRSSDSDSSYEHRRRHKSRRRARSRSSVSTLSSSSMSSRHSVYHKRSPKSRSHRTRRRSASGNEQCRRENPGSVDGAYKNNQNFESMEHIGAFKDNQSFESMEHIEVSGQLSEDSLPSMEQDSCSCAEGTSVHSADKIKVAVSNEAMDAAVQTDIYLMLHFVRNPDVLSDTFLRLDRDNVLNNCDYPEIIPSIYQRKPGK